MKKIILICFIAISVLFSSNAQLFVGGSLNFNVQSGSTESNGISVDDNTYTNFGIKPKVGFFINDDLAIGSSIGFSYRSTTVPQNGNNSEVVNSSSIFEIAPFVRYYVMETGSLSVFGEAELGLGFGGSKTKSGGTTVDGPSIFEIGVSLIPGVSYKITDNIDIEAYLGGIAFSNSSSNNDDTDVKTSSTNFGINLSSNIGLGFVYRF